MSIEDLAAAERQRFPELEGLRGLLALWVLLYHCAAIGGFFDRLPRRLKGVLDGANAVDVFILLSGFVITLLLLRQRESYGVFLFRRFARLAPVFYLAVLLAFVVQYLGFMPQRFSAGHFPALLAAHLVMLHGAIPDWAIPGAAGAFLNPSWSISLEWQFYLVAPLLVGALVRGRWLFAAASIACLIAYRIIAPHAQGFGGSFLPFKIPLFWVGIVSAIAVQRFRSRPESQFPNWLAWAGFMAVPIFLAASVGLIVWGAVMVVLTAPQSDGFSQRIGQALCSNPIQWLGLISYPVYLIHEPLIWLTLGLLKSSGLKPAVALGLGIVLVIVITLAAAHLMHRWIEAPANQWARRRVSERTPSGD